MNGQRTAPRKDFNSRPSARGDEVFLPLYNYIIDFNSRPSARGDAVYPVSRCPETHFNSRPSARGDITADIDPDNNEVFQFTPLREGRRDADNRRAKAAISIHAPPRGATQERRERLPNRKNFNSRPSARGDVSKSRGATCPERFQFTPLREGRRQKICNFCKSFVQPSQITVL